MLQIFFIQGKIGHSNATDSLVLSKHCLLILFTCYSFTENQTKKSDMQVMNVNFNYVLDWF